MLIAYGVFQGGYYIQIVADSFEEFVQKLDRLMITYGDPIDVTWDDGSPVWYETT